MDSKKNFKREVDIAEAMLRQGKCPFDGQHFSSFSCAACEMCNPPKPQKDVI